MISRATFVSIIEAIQLQEERDRKIGKAVDVLSEGDIDGLNNTSFVYTTRLINHLVFVLESEFGVVDEADGTISWWLWDSPDAGKNIEGSTVRYRDGSKFVVLDAGDLYDLMVSESEGTK